MPEELLEEDALEELLDEVLDEDALEELDELEEALLALELEIAGVPEPPPPPQAAKNGTNPAHSKARLSRRQAND